MRALLMILGMCMLIVFILCFIFDVSGFTTPKGEWFSVASIIALSLLITIPFEFK